MTWLAAIAGGSRLAQCRISALGADLSDRPITLVVPFPAGGGNDALARLVAEAHDARRSASRSWWRTAAAPAARSRPARSPRARLTATRSCSSYTGTFAINPTLYPNAGYDPRKDFAPIGSIGTLTSVLVTHPSLPVRSTADLIAYAKANPGKINYGFVPGTVGHIATEMFARSAGIKLTNIPYKGNGNAIADLLGGHVSMMFLSILPVIGKIQAGTLNALAVASPERAPLLPERADDCGIGRARLLGGHHLRARGAAGHAARDRRAAEQGAARGARRRDAAQAARLPKAVRCCRARPRNTQRDHRPRREEMGPAGQEPRPQGGVSDDDMR